MGNIHTVGPNEALVVSGKAEALDWLGLRGGVERLVWGGKGLCEEMECSFKYDEYLSSVFFGMDSI